VAVPNSFGVASSMVLVYRFCGHLTTKFMAVHGDTANVHSTLPSTASTLSLTGPSRPFARLSSTGRCGESSSRSGSRTIAGPTRVRKIDGHEVAVLAFKEQTQGAGLDEPAPTRPSRRCVVSGIASSASSASTRWRRRTSLYAAPLRERSAVREHTTHDEARVALVRSWAEATAGRQERAAHRDAQRRRARNERACARGHS